MFTTLSAATRSTGLRAASALGLLVMVAALSSCADTGRTVEDQQQDRTTQVELDADQSRQSEARDCKPEKREPARAGHGQRANDRREDHRGARKGHDEADENENEWDETDEDENERDENEADENEQDENED